MCIYIVMCVSQLFGANDMVHVILFVYILLYRTHTHTHCLFRRKIDFELICFECCVLGIWVNKTKTAKVHQIFNTLTPDCMTAFGPVEKMTPKCARNEWKF